MRTLLLLLSLFGVLGPWHSQAPAAAQVHYPGGRGMDARLWLEHEPSFFRRGERLNIRFSVSDDAYIAIVHIDSDGNLDFLYPASPWDDGFVRAGRVHSLLPLGARSGWTVRGNAGIGYLYLLASAYPLDYHEFRGSSGSRWQWGYAGRSVHGDPFLAFEQIRRLLLPWGPTGGYYAFDYYTYHVEGIHRYPSFACSDRYFDRGWGWSPTFGSCSRMDLFLSDYPYYYDSRRFRGDRGIYLRDFDRFDPRHGFKEDPDRSGSGEPARSPARPAMPPTREPVPPREPASDRVPERTLTPPTRAPERPAAPPSRVTVPAREPASAPREAPARAPAAAPERTPERPAAAPSRAPAPAREPASAPREAPARAPAAAAPERAPERPAAPPTQAPAPVREAASS